MSIDRSIALSRRGLLTLRLPSGETEPIRTEQKDSDRGRALIERARSLEGRRDI